MSEVQTGSPDLSSSTGSNSTPDSFMYETKFVVLSFLNQITQGSSSKVGAKAESDPRVRQFAKHWKTRSLPSSPPKHRKKQKKVSSHAQKRPFSSDESLHLHVQSSKRSSDVSNQNAEKTESEQGHQFQRKSKKAVSGRHSYPLQSTNVNSPDCSKAQSLPTRISVYQRSISDGSSQDGGSYMSDADDELDTSQGSTISSARGSRNSDFLKASGHHLQVSRLSTVPSESEAEPDLQDSSILNDANNDDLPIEVDDIEFDISSDPDRKHSKELGLNSQVQNGIAESASFDNQQPQRLDKDEDVLDGVDLTESDVSDLESEEICGDKGDDDELEEEEEEEEEGKLGEAAGGADEPVESGYNGSTPQGQRSLDRSQLFLDLSRCPSSNIDQGDVDSVMTSLREEIQDEMLSLESEVDEAIRSRRIQNQPTLFMAPIPAPLTPHTEAAEILARIGDDIVRNHNLMPRVESAVGRLFAQESGCLTYEVFREVAKSIVDESVPGWRQVALLLVYSQSVAFKMVMAGGQGVGNIVDYSVRLLADLTADFIVKQGGWSGLMTTESSSSCLSSPEPGVHQVNPFVSLHVHSTVTQTTVMSTMATQSPTLQTDASSPNPERDSATEKPVEDEKQNGDIQKSDQTDSGPAESSAPAQPDRGDNSYSSWWPSVGNNSNTSFATKCSAALALLSIGLGVAMIYIKR